MYIPLIIGIVLALIAFHLYRKTKNLTELGQKVMGKVVEIKKSVSHDTDEDGYTSTSVNYYPIIDFKTLSGEKVTFKARVGNSNKNAYKIDQSVEIIYNKENPKEASINSFFQLWLMPLIFGIISIMCFVVFYFMYVGN